MTSLAQINNRPCVVCKCDRVHYGLKCGECGTDTVLVPWVFKPHGRSFVIPLTHEEKRVRKNEARRERRRGGARE